jgi:Flp pilus assembly protein TadG
VSRQQGAATVVVVALLVVGMVLALFLTDVARVAAARARLTSAADAAALAAAPATFADFGAGADPYRSAAETAQANDAHLMECNCPVDRSWATRMVRVVVALDVDLTLLGSRHLEASAAAEFSPVLLGGGP